MRKFLILIFACSIGACVFAKDTNFIIKGNGSFLNDKSVSIEIPASDTTINISVSEGHFSQELSIDQGQYARLLIGKQVFPLWLKPKGKLKLNLKINNLDFTTFKDIVLNPQKNQETLLMNDFYAVQELPQKEEIFPLVPEEFKAQIIAYNAKNIGMVDDLTVLYSKVDTAFVRLFKYQTQVPLAFNYFYYPQFHHMMNPNDESDIPEDFNIFNTLLPKNDLYVYSNVYRYPLYENSYWHNSILAEIDAGSYSDINSLATDYKKQLASKHLDPAIVRNIMLIFNDMISQ